MTESWQTGTNTNASVEQIGDFDGVKWAMEAGHVTLRKAKKKKNRKLEDRLSLVAVHGDGLMLPEDEHYSESQKQQLEHVSLDVE